MFGYELGRREPFLARDERFAAHPLADERTPRVGHACLEGDVVTPRGLDARARRARSIEMAIRHLGERAEQLGVNRDHALPRQALDALAARVIELRIVQPMRTSVERCAAACAAERPFPTFLFELTPVGRARARTPS